MVSDTTEEIGYEDVRVGDKITATRTEPDGTEIAYTGVVRKSYYGETLVIGVDGFAFTRKYKIIRHLPDWRDAQVIQVGGKVLGLPDPRPVARWISLGTLDYGWFSDVEVAELGEVRIIVDKDGNVVGR